MNICSLNNKNNKYCFDDYIIPKLNENNKGNKEPEAVINDLAKKTRCDGKEGPEKALCVLKNIRKKSTNNEIVKLANTLILENFKPPTKSFDHNYWLNNTEIDSIQHQLYKSFKGYYYSNIHMIDLIMIDPKHIDQIDYDVHPLSDIDIVKELNKVDNKLTHNGDLKYYGLVVNTDFSSNSGLHWFSIFMDFTVEPHTIEYFNSSGYDIKNAKFKQFLIKLADVVTFDDNTKDCEFVKVTSIQHQSSETANCGSYALYYIYKRLTGTPHSYFANNKITDDEARGFREVLFRLEK